MASDKKKLKPKGVLITFRNPKAKPTDLVKFCRGLFGYRNHSNKGKYLYERRGLLDDIPHILVNPVRSVLVVMEKDAQRILDFLKTHGAEVYTRKVELEPEDLKKLKGDVHHP